MEVTRLADALPYEAPRHHGIAALRLHGGEQTNAERVVVGLSHFLPGGGADASSSEAERVYVVLEGLDSHSKCNNSAKPLRQRS